MPGKGVVSRLCQNPGSRRVKILARSHGCLLLQVHVQVHVETEAEAQVQVEIKAKRRVGVMSMLLEGLRATALPPRLLLLLLQWQRY